MYALRSRGSTGRSKRCPQGNANAPSVRVGNLQASRCALLLLFAAAKQVWWLLEQPKGSLLQDFPLMNQVMRQLGAVRKQFRMKGYGAPTEKPTWLYSSILVLVVWSAASLVCKCLLTRFFGRGHEHVQDLDSFAPHGLKPAEHVELVEHYVDQSGQHRVKGSKFLKASQSYPRQLLG